MRFAIVVSRFNEDVTGGLLQGALQYLNEKKSAPTEKDIFYAPGAFELPLIAKALAKKKKYDGVICLGCVIQGETRHFDFICDAVAHGITNVSLKFNKPVIFGVLTPNNQQQALDRAGGKHGNKGDEAAITAIKMLGF